MNDLIGWAQIAAMLVLAQRGLEELHSARNARRVLAEGGFETGHNFYPVAAVAHLIWS